ncbi:MAG TPA: choice-of-anchor tandem repeat GloVer-containing protein, partial [Candidatus Angelobacter sp.]
MKKPSGKLAAVSLVLVLATAVATRAQTPTFTLLHSFTGSSADGAIPVAPLLRDAAGNLYGATAFGGSTNCSVFGDVGCGTIFKLDPSGNETVLHMFSGGDGAFPAGGLVMDAAGNLYGTTVNGGGAGLCRNFGCGTVFKLDPSGNLTVLHSFIGSSDGANPTAGLIMDAAGNLYGTAGFGGDFGPGAVFKLDASGNETTLHSFSGPDGREPSAPLIMDAAGNLYSTTFRGGAADRGNVFKLDTSQRLTVLHEFTGLADGGNPAAGLIMDAAGNLYGTTGSGGVAGVGTVFKLDPSGNLTVLHSFTGGDDGGNEALEGIPAAGLIMDAANNLYGTAFRGGAARLGNVFKLDPVGNETVLYSFTGGSDGSGPLAPLIMDAAGNLYGTASSFMASGSFGSVFK